MSTDFNNENKKVFVLKNCLFASKNVFSIADLRQIWKALRETYTLEQLSQLHGNATLPGYENLTLGEFAMIQLHFKPQRSTQKTTLKIPTEEWWSLVSQQFISKPVLVLSHVEEKKQTQDESKQEESEFPFHLFENSEDEDDAVEENEKVEETKEIKPKHPRKKLTAEEKRLKRRHTRRLREGLNSSNEFPTLSLAQIRLYLYMIRSLDEFPMNQIVGMSANGTPLELQDFAIRYLFAEQMKRYNIKMKQI